MTLTNDLCVGQCIQDANEQTKSTVAIRTLGNAWPPIPASPSPIGEVGFTTVWQVSTSSLRTGLHRPFKSVDIWVIVSRKVC